MEINIKSLKKIKLPRIKLPKVDLLDGQRRGEVVFRRVFVLIVAGLVLYLLLLVFVGKKDQNVEEVQAVESVVGVDGAGRMVKDGDIVNGQEVSVEDGKAWYIQEYSPTEETEDTREFDETEKIYEFTQSYRGSRIDADYFNLLKKECNDPELLKSVIAISVAESGMGRDLPYRQSNFWGWFKNNNRSYDPSREQMAKDICTGVGKYYSDVDSDWSLIVRYTGNDNPTNWYRIYTWAIKQMEVQNGK